MSGKVSAERIAEVFGIERFPFEHAVRVLHSERMVYVLHSQHCVETHPDLRECRYSKAMDEGINEDLWAPFMEKIVIATVDPFSGELSPVSIVADDAPADPENSYRRAIRLARERVSKDNRIVAYGEVGEPSNGALMLKLAELLEKEIEGEL